MSLIDKASFRPEINALRALAVIGVIGYHFGIPGFSGGFAGVDVFFVISGYLITSQIQQGLLLGTFNYGAFYVSRLRRIFPALALMCFAVMVFGWWFIFSNEYIEHAKSALQALYFGSNNGFIKPEGGGGYFYAVNTAVSPFLHTWSLSIEGQFYVVFPIIWVIIYKKWRANQINIVLFSFIAAVSYFAYDTLHHTEQSFYSLPVRAWEFLAGACLVVLPQRMPSKLTANLVSAAGVICLVVSGYFLDASLLWPSYWTAIPIIGTLGVLVARNAASSRWLFNNWLVQRAGDMSYSLYLWHWPLIVFAKQYVAIHDRALTAAELVILLVATTVLAFLSWRFVEMPIRRNKTLWTTKRIVVLVVIVLISFWGAWRYAALTHGIPTRMGNYMSQAKYEKIIKIPEYAGLCILEQRSSVKMEDLVFCNLNESKQKSPSILMWGDSHMHHYYPAIRQAAMDLKLNGIVATRAGCRPTLPNEYPYNSYSIEKEAELCKEFNNEINRKLAKTPSITTVILGRLWFDDESVYQTINLAKSLALAGKKVILLGAIPKPKSNVSTMFIQQQIWQRRSISEMAVLRSTQSHLDNLDGYTGEQLSSEILKGQIIFINSMSHFCDQQECFLVKNGINNYWDDSHITKAKALEFVDEFKRALKQ